MRTNLIPDSSCPTCTSIMNAATAIDTKVGRGPKRGDLTVCISCGEFLRFGETLQLETIPSAEFALVDKQTQDMLFRARTAVLQLRQMIERGIKAGRVAKPEEFMREHDHYGECPEGPTLGGKRPGCFRCDAFVKWVGAIV